jgi:hypothetical protein
MSNNNAQNVTAGKPLINGAIFRAPLGTALPTINRGDGEVIGRNLANGMAINAKVTSKEICYAIRPALASIVHQIRLTLESTPPELASDICSNGIVLSGGGALLPGIAEFISAELGVKVMVAPKPLECVCVGIGKMLETIETVCPGITLCRVNLVASLPVVDLVCAVGTGTYKIECSCHTRIGIIYAPLGAERHERGVSLKSLEVAPFTRYVKSMRALHIVTLIADVTQEIWYLFAVEIILNLLMEERSGLAGHTALRLPHLT